MSTENEGKAVEKQRKPHLSERKATVKFDLKAKKRFLTHLEKHGIMSAAADHIGISRVNVYKTMEKDPRFKERVEIAKERHVANLEQEFEDRIYEGNEKLKYDGEGNLLERVVTKDNALLVKALEANMPEKYGKKEAGNTTNNVVINGDSAINKLAQFLKVDLDSLGGEKKVIGEVIENDDEDVTEGDYEEE